MNGFDRPGATTAERDGLTRSAEALATLSAPVRSWFLETFPRGPTPAQALAWPPIAARENVLLIAPTGAGKTLAAFLSVMDRLVNESKDESESKSRGENKNDGPGSNSGVRCVYVSPLRSLNYDVERNLEVPLAEIRRRLGLGPRAARVGVRTGDASAHERRALRDDPPRILIATPESLSLLLSHDAWRPHWRGVELVVVDEIHALAPNKRGADLAVSIERLAALARTRPQRIGLSATCGPDEALTRFLVGNSGKCRVIEAPMTAMGPARARDRSQLELHVETLIKPGEAPHRGLSYHRLLRRLRSLIAANRTTIVFANTRAFVEKITRDLKDRPKTVGDCPDFARDHGRPARDGLGPDDAIAAHHSALDSRRRRAVESGLRAGTVRAVVTSTSLELGVDIGTADLVVQIGPPGGVARCLQRVGRSGHRVGGRSRGILLAATPGELIAAAVTARLARAGRVETSRVMSAPLDVVCQQLVGMACSGEQSTDGAFETIRNAGPMAALALADFDACLAYLAGELAAPAGAVVGHEGDDRDADDDRPRWTAPRLWKHAGRFGIRDRRAVRWFRANVGTIRDEPPTRVLVENVPIGTLEASFAERLARGDRFVLDGRALEVERLAPAIVHARLASGEAALPRWSSDRQSCTPELARALAAFRDEAARRLASDGPMGLRGWLFEELELGPDAAAVVVELFQAQEQWSAVPSAHGLLVEESPATDEGLIYTFHAPLNRAACEALARAAAARLGRRQGRDLRLRVADLGWSIHAPGLEPLAREEIAALLNVEGLEDDALLGLDRGELPARRFARVASIALMVVSSAGRGPRVRVGGRNWASERLYPLVRAACPDHPLLRQTRRETLEEALDLPAARHWLETRPTIAVRSLPGLSPFAAAWIEPAETEPLHFESPAESLLRLHRRLMRGNGAGETVP